MAFKTLPRPQFSLLQQKIFPIYFGMQTALPAVLALTYPGVGTASGIQGVFVEANQSSVLAPLATMFITGLANMVLLRPATAKIMKARKLQGIIFQLPQCYRI